MSECCKLVQREYQTKYQVVEKEVHRELCKNFKFDYTNKWYWHNPEYGILR